MLWDRLSVITNAYEFKKKKYAVTNTENDLGKYVFIFTTGFNTREQTSIQWDRMQR